MLKPNNIKYWVDHIEYCLKKNKPIPENVDHVIPHVSSMFFYSKLADEIEAKNIDLEQINGTPISQKSETLLLLPYLQLLMIYIILDV